MTHAPSRALHRTAILLLPLALAAGCEGRQAGLEAVPSDSQLTFQDIAPDTSAFLEILEVEDRRASRPGDLARLNRATASPHPGIRRAAARGLGRLERPEVAQELIALLGDGDPGVQAEAANALAQSVRGGDRDEVARARNALAAALVPTVPEAGNRGPGGASSRALPLAAPTLTAPTLGTLARSLGRLPLHDLEDVQAGAAALLQALEVAREMEGGAAAVHLGVARGALFLHRGMAARRALEAGGSVDGESEGEGGTVDAVESLGALRDRLESLSRESSGWTVRLAAAQALRAAGDISPELARGWLGDEAAEVRREGAAALIGGGGVGVASALAAALEDPADQVRVEAVRSFARLRRTGDDCGPLLHAARDPSTHVALTALEALAGTPQGGACADAVRVLEFLESEVKALPAAGETGWQGPARALVTLARLDPDRARPLLPAFLAHPHPFVRAQGARAAGILGERDLLELAEDSHANVREAALRAISELPGGVPLPVLHAQLEQDDPMLLRTSAQLLQGREASRPRGGPSRAEVAEALLTALERVSASGAMTYRDARVPLLRQVGAWGAGADAPRLEPFLRDFDPVVAEEAARILTGWTRSEVTETPQPFSDGPLPGLALLREMEEMTVEVEMVDGGRFTLRLFPFEAPTNAARFVAMAREGTFDGLTLHRVVPNFVVQGGSPGANEYAGHGDYTRDELGLPGHWRGTVGISTRGRDTGDGQIFVNLVSNLRLDHDYTVFAVVDEGMEVVDAIREGDRMATVRVRSF
jgi:cyclophilin family peptidyl-prolyl cis-trans isomerase/HEAT repeat protein